MNFELQPHTDAGHRFVTLAEEYASAFAASSEKHDRDNSFAAENIVALRKSGLAGATVPEELGGIGVERLVDYVAGINRLGRGDGATALAANMHIFLTWFVAREWRRARATEDRPRIAQWEEMLRDIAAGRTILSALATEPGHDLMHVVTEATRTTGGWLLKGRKGFATGSPAADVFVVACRHRNDNGEWRYSAAYVRADSQGVTNMHNWDALGMRGSGSHDVVLEDCPVANTDFFDVGPWGAYNEDFLAGNFAGTLGLVAVFLGIAEAARDITLKILQGRRATASRKAAIDRSAIHHIVAEIEIDLSASRAMVERTGTMMDAFFAAQSPTGNLPLQEMHEVMKDFQCTKWFVTRKAIETVDRALTLSGGAGYMSRNPLSRLYRDVRAGPFMQPFSPIEAFEYIGKVTLGVDPMVEL
jgi:alkylation response protein AidB-like acyl-CoA dehydrogenase